MLRDREQITEAGILRHQIRTALAQQKLLSEISFDLTRIDLHFGEKINQTLRKLGEFLNVSRIYIFEDSPGKESTSNTFEWCNEGIEPMIEILQDIPYSIIPSWWEILDRDGRIFSRDIREFPEDIRAILEPQHIKAILVYPLRLAGNRHGFIGFDECVMNRNWEETTVELLRTISNLLSNEFERRMIHADLLRSKEAAEQASRAKEVFLANMSHEIRTPLNVIIGMSNLLAGTSVDDRQRHYLQAIRISADNLLVIINDILDISKIEAGRLELESVPFSLEQVIHQVTGSQGIHAAEKNIILGYDYDRQIPPVIVGDPFRLTQVLLNLVNNAVKFTDKGNVRVICRLEEVTETHCKIHFAVTDTGAGIKPEILDRIFDSFQQGDVSVSRKHGGTGLGLSITQQLISLFGGEIQVSSRPGEGTRFYFELTFRIGDKLPAEQSSDISAELCLLRGKRILLVEDNEFNRMVAVSILEQWNLVTDIAVNGREALQKLESGTYDLILMDIQMPVMDGIEATISIRRDLKLETPIIALTAHALKSEKEKYLRKGMNGYISKPFEPRTLLHAICTLIGGNTLEEKPGPLPVSLEPSPPAPPPEKGLYDLHSLKEIADGNPAFEQKMISIFVEQTSESLQELRPAIDQHDYMRIREIIHHIKPSVSLMGISFLERDIARILEYPSMNPDPAGITDMANRVATTLSTVIIQLQELIRRS